MALRPALLSATRRLIDETDSTNSHFEDSDIYLFINQAIRYLGTDLEWALQTAQATPVEDQAVYTLPEDFISLVDVYYGNIPLYVISREDLPSIRADWQNAESSTPVYCYKSDNAKIGLWPPPSAVAVADSQVIQIQYIKVPPDLSDDTTAPDLHIAFHDCLPFFAAALCEKSMGNLKASADNMKWYENFRERLTSKVQRFSDQELRMRWPRNI